MPASSIGSRDFVLDGALDLEAGHAVAGMTSADAAAGFAAFRGRATPYSGGSPEAV